MMAYEEYSDPKDSLWSEMSNDAEGEDNTDTVTANLDSVAQADDSLQIKGGDHSEASHPDTNAPMQPESRQDKGRKPGGRRRRRGQAVPRTRPLSPEAIVSLSQEFYGFVLSMVDVTLINMRRMGLSSMTVPLDDRVYYRCTEGGMSFHEFMFGLQTSPYGGWLTDRDRSPWHAMVPKLLLPFDKLRRDLVKAKGVYLMVEHTSPNHTRVVLHTRKSLQCRKTYIITTSTGRTAMCLNPTPARHTFDVVPW